MAHRKLYLTETGAQVYRTRMLSAGDPVTLGARDARLFEKHGWAEERRRARRAAEPEPIIPTVDEVLNAEVVDAPAPQSKKAAPKRATRRKAKK